MKRNLQLLFLVSLLLAFGYNFSQSRSQRPIIQKTYDRICDLVEANFFRQDESLEIWLSSCRQNAVRLREDVKLKEFITHINLFLSELDISHLALWEPAENRQKWESEFKETGIRVRYIEDRYIIVKVIPKSPAEAAGLQVGDIIVSINNEVVLSAWDPRARDGDYEMLRGEETFQVSLKTVAMEIEESPTVNAISSHTALLTIPTFTDHYFEKGAWTKIIEEAQLYRHLVVDLRDNTGGNFPACLRALSPFLCTKSPVGTLVQRAKRDHGSFEIPDDETDILSLMDQYKTLELSSFDDYPCINSRVTLLINSKSASVTEIFAKAFEGRKGSRIWGEKSAGSVVAAVWYELPLGSEYNLSLPQAVYETPTGETLEGVGVTPSRELRYSLQEAIEGVDTWVREAVESPWKASYSN
jgi:carboxyl-terminal processing protease